MTKLYVMDLQNDQTAWRDLLQTLPKERQQRALSCRFDEDKMRITCAGVLLQKALERAGIPAQEQVFDHNPWGKPVLKDNPHIHFSLSHSGNWAVCAVSDDPVGVDVEFPRCTMAVAKRQFHPTELDGLDTLSPKEQADTLNRLWTAKEAFIKLLGKGLAIPLDSFTVRLAQEAILTQNYTPLPCQLHEYRLGLYRVCLCCTGLRPELEVIDP